MQTNLKATFAGISIVFSFYGEDQKHFYDLKSKQIDVGSHVHYLGAECRDISLLVQVIIMLEEFSSFIFCCLYLMLYMVSFTLT